MENASWSTIGEGTDLEAKGFMPSDIRWSKLPTSFDTSPSKLLDLHTK
jgi:hypothetical protein